jgi:hypothetical protein
MGLIRIFILNMIEILGRSFQREEQQEKCFWNVWRLKNQRKPLISLSERPAEFHDIKKARWKFLSGFSMLFPPCRVTSSPSYSLSTLHFLPSLI